MRYDESGRGQYRSAIEISVSTLTSSWQMSAYLPHKKGFAGYTTRFWHPAYVKRFHILTSMLIETVRDLPWVGIISSIIGFCVLSRYVLGNAAMQMKWRPGCVPGPLWPPDGLWHLVSQSPNCLGGLGAPY